jgi:hypothetical protein
MAGFDDLPDDLVLAVFAQLETKWDRRAARLASTTAG